MDEINQLIEISQFYGRDNRYVIAGGGNTSYKNNEKIWVKSSGFALSTITEEGFAVLDRAKLSRISSNTYSTDSFERERQIKDDLNDACITSGKRPSVETSLHNAIGYSFVIHLHPTLVNGLMCGNDAEKLTYTILGGDVLFVPYIDPGYVLFKDVEARITNYRALYGFDPKVILLQNHGIFVSSDNCDEVKDIYSHIMAKLEAQLKIKLVASDDEPSVNHTFKLANLPLHGNISNVVPAIRMLVSTDEVKALKVRNNTLVEHFTQHAEAYKKISKPFTPDIIVYCKSKYIYIEDTSSPKEILDQLESLIPEFHKANGYMPKVILLKDYGLIACGDHAAQCDTILDVFEDLLKISFYSVSFGGPHFMTPEQIQFIDTWEVENYRRKVSAGAGRAGRVENKTIIVTGAAMGFGEGIAEGLANEGANIVVADINQAVGLETAARLSALPGNNRAIFVKTNVGDEASIQNLMNETVAHFGGVDVFISNAGILRAGGLDEMDISTFDLVTKINYNAYFYCTKFASAIMRLQNQYNPGYYADIIQINSKSGLKGSKKNFAYAGGKFGGIGLTQSFALELAPYKIKVNSICPGNFYEGPLWSDPENGLFVQYLNAGKVPGAKTIDDVKDFYLSQVPLGKGCTPVDVVKGALYLIDQENETGQALPITGGQTMLN